MRSELADCLPKGRLKERKVMKKALMLSAAAAVTLAACSAADNPNPQEEQPVVGMANPASEFCVRQGGRLEPKKDAQGNEYALCPTVRWRRNGNISANTANNLSRPSEKSFQTASKPYSWRYLPRPFLQRG